MLIFLLENIYQLGILIKYGLICPPWIWDQLGKKILPFHLEAEKSQENIYKSDSIMSGGVMLAHHGGSGTSGHGHIGPTESKLILEKLGRFSYKLNNDKKENCFVIQLKMGLNFALGRVKGQKGQKGTGGETELN